MSLGHATYCIVTLVVIRTAFLDFLCGSQVERLKGSVQKAEREALEWKAAAEQRAQEAGRHPTPSAPDNTVGHRHWKSLDGRIGNLCFENHQSSHESSLGERSPRGPGEERHLRTRQEEGGSHTGTDSCILWMDRTWSDWSILNHIEPTILQTYTLRIFKRHCTTQLFHSLFDDRGAKVGGGQVSSKLGVCEAKKSTDEAIKKLEDAKKQLAEAALQDTRISKGDEATSRRVVWQLTWDCAVRLMERSRKQRPKNSLMLTLWSPIDLLILLDSLNNRISISISIKYQYLI